ncbi:hypothetical protein BGX34_008630 [Mortierella sp. NVP85]|nr:hypothetical protein BGX34_008630 [Mortierella sp. NVP85]
MAPTNPLELQEIADLVATYLEGKDLGRCVRVSKNWRDIFLPHRWRVVRVGFIYERDLGTDVYFGPDQDSIHNHRHRIQDLSLHSKIGDLDEHNYPNVRRLEINMIHSKAPINYVTMDFTKWTPLLVDLKMDDVMTEPEFWESLSKHPHLRTLALSNMWLKNNVAAGFWCACMKLEKLEMVIVSIEDTGRPRNVVFDRLRKLTMMGTDLQEDGYQLDLILQSPILESLDWSMNNLSEVKKLSQNRRWPHLSRLSLYCDLHLEEDIAYILDDVGGGLGSLVDFGFCNTLGTHSTRALRTHFSTLAKVDLIGYEDDGVAVVDMLCHCPRLEVLLAKRVFAIDIAERGPWICQQLRELEIWFQFAESEQALHPLVFERLSTLVRLERLNMSYDEACLEDHVGLEFRLDCGLGRLASLQQLTGFGFYLEAPSPELGVEEVTWMVDNWKKLKMVKGPLNSDKTVAAQLKEIIESHGINIS